MDTLIIEGGHRLRGELPIAGMKNAATPILAATILATKPCVLHNVPDIADVNTFLQLLASLGADVERQGSTVTVSTHKLKIEQLDRKSVKSMRSSILLLGPLLARFRHVELPHPGGCIIGNRPIDDHLIALEQVGATVRQTKEGIELQTDGLKGHPVLLPQFSVTATENVLLAAVLASGRTTIKLAAAEPHVQDLCHFLNKLGARITGIGTHELTIDGVDELGGTEHHIIPDQIEVGTFAVAVAVSHGHVSLTHIAPEHLDLILYKLRQAKVPVRIVGKNLEVESAPQYDAFRLQTMPYPGFPTDLQAPFSVLATQATGTSLIHDPLYEGRMGYVSELVKMGANAVVCDPHRVLITGPTPLYGAEIRGLDLRAGATLVLAGLVAQGETIIRDAQVLDRGYERIEQRLAAVGAHIRRITG